jgi:hypothetical protein
VQEPGEFVVVLLQRGTLFGILIASATESGGADAGFGIRSDLPDDGG